MSELKLNAIGKSYGGVEILRDINIEVADGEFVVFVGPSGCGKSTLLRLIAGLEEISAGELAIGGRRVNELTPAERGIAMVFQSYALYPHMSVYQNMAFGLKLGREGKDAIDQKVRRAAEILQLNHLLERKPAALSGGQRQRVAIGRAIVRDPNVFLFDEPLSNLDAALRVQTRIEIAKLHQDLKATIIYVTHDQVEAMTLASKIVVLNKGRVEQVGAPLELYERPRNRFVAGFIGSPSMNFVPARVEAIADRGITVSLPGGAHATLPCAPSPARVGDEVTVGIRPEHLFEAGGAELQLSGTVEVVERLGDVSYVYFRLADGTALIARAEGTHAAQPGETVSVGSRAAHVHVFDGAGDALPRLDAPAPTRH